MPLPPLEPLQFDVISGMVEGADVVQRRLSDLQGAFADAGAYQAALSQGNPLLYTVSATEPEHGDGALHYALGRLMPGRIGREYYLTKGHYHAWRPAAEVYVGLAGQGIMLLEDDRTGECRTIRMTPNSVVYVPGHTVHRTANIGGVPLVYLGIYPAAAGHDYGSIAERNFRQVVVEEGGRPVVLDRSTFLESVR
jgi:glucose-6-phosphate isomerase, archaeal